MGRDAIHFDVLARKQLAAEYRAAGMDEAAWYTEEDRGLPYSPHTAPAIAALTSVLKHPVELRERCEIAFRRAGGLPRLCRAPEGPRKILDIIEAEARAVLRTLEGLVK